MIEPCTIAEMAELRSTIVKEKSVPLEGEDDDVDSNPEDDIEVDDNDEVLNACAAPSGIHSSRPSEAKRKAVNDAFERDFSPSKERGMNHGAPYTTH